MTLQLELTSEEEARLARGAQAQGMDLTQYAKFLLGLELPTGIRPSVDEWEAALDELSKDVDASIPPLTEEATSRRSIYGNRA